MKKTFLLLAASVMCILMQAQVLEIVSMQKVATPQGMEAKVAGISPMGDYLLLTSDVNSGLIRYDIATGELNTISEADGAGWAVKISADGQDIVYRERYFDANQLSKHNVFEYNMASSDKAVVAKAQRDMTTLVHANNANSVTINEDLHMVLVHNGKNIVLAPNGQQHAYNWASISPDGSKILYYVSGVGCFVCDIYGQGVRKIASHCRAPQWYDNNTIIGMADEDDGKYITASSIVVYTLDGKHQILVDKHMVAMYPYAADGKVAFSTAAGEVYILQVK